MRNLNHPSPRPSTAINHERRPGDRPLTRRQLSPELLSDAVVAGYIHDISTRHGRSGTRGERSASFLVDEHLHVVDREEANT